MLKRELMMLEAIPVYQNKMFETAAAALLCPRGDVALVQDATSGLVHNGAFDPDKLQYDDSYQNEQGHSPVFQAHVEQVLGIVGRHFSGLGILEIGCGKGAFIELMRAAGYDARGVDPAYEGDSPYIIRRHFEAGLGIRGDAIVMRHVLEHIVDPFSFLENVRNANGGGLIYIEVPCFEWIVQHCAWFDVFYEHVNYFRVADFARVFGRVLESGHLFGGQYIYVVADLASLREPGTAALGTPQPVAIRGDFFASLDRCTRAVRPGARRAVWGAGAKGVMFTHYMARRGCALDVAIDINPAKQNRFLAGSGLPVLGPAAALATLGEAPDIFVMNSNYLSEIRVMGGPGPNYIAVDTK
ncbi:MAG TPA: class I SAM-dependent methyltransferase [Gammaproteobacteria bacterium]|nr:class I SAM-dependent methyltransferase [Gammaproteobacteria bacterium]